MIFSLETLQGKHGDCLLLYYGKNDNPKVIVIDGGPAGVYRKFLKPRLLEVKESLSPDDPLPFSMVMVSHLDDDHINGILAMTEEIVDKQEANEAQEFTFKNIWCNTFDDIIGNIQIPKISSLPASVSAASVNAVPEIAGPRIILQRLLFQPVRAASCATMQISWLHLSIILLKQPGLAKPTWCTTGKRLSNGIRVSILP